MNLVYQARYPCNKSAKKWQIRQCSKNKISEGPSPAWVGPEQSCQIATQSDNPESYFPLIIMIVSKDIISLFSIFCVYMRVNCMCDSNCITDAQVHALATHWRMDMCSVTCQQNISIPYFLEVGACYHNLDPVTQRCCH